MDSNRIIQSLWIGNRLSTMERLCLASFMANGHEFHLYLYDDCEGVPSDCIVERACEIMPGSFLNKFPGPAQFADMFRYKLLLDKGGWWVDTDIACLKHFDFPSDYAFAATPALEGHISVGYIKAPMGSPLMDYVYRMSQRKASPYMGWGTIGSELLTPAVEKFDLGMYEQSFETFGPIGWDECPDRFLNPEGIELSAATYAVHFCRDMWRRAGKDPDGHHPDGCLYEQLKARYL